MIGLITGSGFGELDALLDRESERVETAYGSVTVTMGKWHGRDDVAFIARHGSGHSIAPHLINYRANIAALHAVGVRAVVATAVSGAITAGWGMGDLVLVSDFLNFTTGRNDTFFDSVGSVRHTEMTTAYDPDLRALIFESAASAGVSVADGAVYSTFNGPRFESPAEIRMAERAGADLVGMTGYPEVVLARERGLAYASIAIVVNQAAGKGVELSIPEIMAVISAAAPNVEALLGATVASYSEILSDPAKAGLRMVAGDEGSEWEMSAGENQSPSNKPTPAEQNEAQ